MLCRQAQHDKLAGSGSPPLGVGMAPCATPLSRSAAGGSGWSSAYLITVRTCAYRQIQRHFRTRLFAGRERLRLSPALDAAVGLAAGTQLSKTPRQTVQPVRYSVPPWPRAVQRMTTPASCVLKRAFATGGKRLGS